MRALVPPLVTLVAITAFSGCDNPIVRQSPVAATPVTVPAATPTPTPSIAGVLTFSSFAVTRSQSHIVADFTLTETAGGRVWLESLIFEDSAGDKDFGCIEPFPISSHDSLDGKSLGYCQPIITTQSAGDFASLTAVYTRADGGRDTVKALIRVPHDVAYAP